MISGQDLFKVVKNMSIAEKNYFKGRSKKLYPKSTEYNTNYVIDSSK